MLMLHRYKRQLSHQFGDNGKKNMNVMENFSADQSDGPAERQTKKQIAINTAVPLAWLATKEIKPKSLHFLEFVYTHRMPIFLFFFFPLMPPFCLTFWFCECAPLPV